MNGKFRLVQADPAAANTSLLATGDAEEGFLSDEPARLNGELKTIDQAVQEAEAQPAHAEPIELDRVGQALRRIDPLWDVLFPAEQQRIVRLLVDELVVNPDALVIRLRLNGLNALVAELQGEGPAELGTDGQTVDVHVPMEFKRRGGRKEIVLPPDVHTTPDVGPRRPIVVALARAFKWQKMMDTGEVASMDELAAKYSIDRCYARRILRLASLAPDIIEAVLQGNEPEGISLRRLQKGLPVSWQEQRERWRRRR